MRKWDRKIKRITYWLTPYLMKFVYQLVWKWVKIRLSTLFVSTNYFYFKPKVSMLNSSLTFDWLGHVIVENKWNIPGKEMKWRNQLREILLALFYTHLVKKKKFIKFDHQPRSQGSLRLTGIQIEFENEFKKIIFRPGAHKNKKTKKSKCIWWNLLDINTTTGYISGHKDVFSTSFKTGQSKFSERKPTKRVFMTGSELRCTCYVTAYVWWTQLANQWNCR